MLLLSGRQTFSLGMQNTQYFPENGKFLSFPLTLRYTENQHLITASHWQDHAHVFYLSSNHQMNF